MKYIKYVKYVKKENKLNFGGDTAQFDICGMFSKNPASSSLTPVE